jgi:hypothetical protein
MSSRRKFTAEFKVEAAHRVIDSRRSVAEVARELSLGDQLLGRWVRDERRRVDTAAGHRVRKRLGIPGLCRGPDYADVCVKLLVRAGSVGNTSA